MTTSHHGNFRQLSSIDFGGEPGDVDKIPSFFIVDCYLSYSTDDTVKWEKWENDFEAAISILVFHWNFTYTGLPSYTFFCTVQRN
jgi:hypothetical protein